MRERCRSSGRNEKLFQRITVWKAQHSRHHGRSDVGRTTILKRSLEKLSMRISTESNWLTDVSSKSYIKIFREQKNTKGNKNSLNNCDLTNLNLHSGVRTSAEPNSCHWGSAFVQCVPGTAIKPKTYITTCSLYGGWNDNYKCTETDRQKDWMMDRQVQWLTKYRISYSQTGPTPGLCTTITLGLLNIVINIIYHFQQ